jgi:hypothetical protein
MRFMRIHPQNPKKTQQSVYPQPSKLQGEYLPIPPHAGGTGPGWATGNQEFF